MIFFESCIVYVVIMSSMRMSPFERQKPPSKKAISSAEAEAVVAEGARKTSRIRRE